MPTPVEAARLAAAVNLLRPDWPTASLRTLIDDKHSSRPLHDLAVALAWVATDPGSRTPARINEAGPWWVTPATASQAQLWDVRPCHRCGCLHLASEDCPTIAAKPRHSPANPATVTAAAAQARQAIRAAKTDTRPIPDLQEAM